MIRSDWSLFPPEELLCLVTSEYTMVKNQHLSGKERKTIMTNETHTRSGTRKRNASPTNKIYSEGYTMIIKPQMCGFKSNQK